MHDLVNILFLLIIIIVGWYYVYRNFRKFNLLTLFVISEILFFDVYTLLDIFLGANEYQSEFVFLITLFIIFISATIFILLYKILIRTKLKNLLTFKSFTNHVNNIPDGFLFVLFIILLLIVGYYFFRYRLFVEVYYYGNNSILNNYNIIMTSFVIPLFYLIIGGSTLKIINSKGKISKVAFIMVISFTFLYLLFYSRRNFFEGILLFLILYSYLRKFNVFALKLKNIFIILLIAVVFIMGSNLYQNTRYSFTQYANNGYSNEINLTTLWMSMFDIKASQQNLIVRQSLFSFDYDVVKKIIYSNKTPMGGRIIFQSFLNSIPSIIYPNKTVILDNSMIVDHFNLPHVDSPVNIILIVIADFGLIASIIIYPIIMFLYLLFFIFLLRLFKNDDLLSSVIFIILYDIFFNVQMPFDNLFISIRNILILVVVLKLYQFFTQNARMP